MSDLLRAREQSTGQRSWLTSSSEEARDGRDGAADGRADGGDLGAVRLEAVGERVAKVAAAEDRAARYQL